MEKSQRMTDEIYLTTETHPPEEGQTTRFIDINIYDFPTEQKEPPSIESEPAPEPTPEEADKQEDTEPGQPPRQSRRRAAIVCVSVLCILLLLGGCVLYLFPLVTMSATVTIVPVIRQINTTNTIIVVTGQPATGAQQIAGSQLSSVTMSQQQTVPTTGKGHQDAQAEHGLVTFYNAAPYAQTIITHRRRRYPDRD